MTVDLDSIKNLVIRCKNALPFGADDRHSISRIAQCACFLPYASVKRYRKVLYDDTDSRGDSSLHALQTIAVVVSGDQNMLLRRRRSPGRHRRPAYADVIKSMTSHLRRVKHISAIHNKRTFDG